MKTVCILIFLLFPLVSFAQNKSCELETICHTKYGSFGGPVIKMTEIYGDTTFMLGAKGAFLYDNKYYIGGAAYSVVNNNDYLNNATPNEKYNFSYVGLMLGRLFTPSKNFHINTQLLVGTALTFLYRKDLEEKENPIKLSEVDFGFVSEGEVGILYDVNRFLKLELSTGFRYVHPSQYFTSKDLNSYSLNLGFWFGKY